MPCVIRGRSIKIEKWNGSAWVLTADSDSQRGATITARHQSRHEVTFYRVIGALGKELVRFNSGVETMEIPRPRGRSPIERMVDEATGFKP